MAGFIVTKDTEIVGAGWDAAGAWLDAAESGHHWETDAWGVPLGYEVHCATDHLVEASFGQLGLAWVSRQEGPRLIADRAEG